MSAFRVKCSVWPILPSDLQDWVRGDWECQSAHRSDEAAFPMGSGISAWAHRALLGTMCPCL